MQAKAINLSGFISVSLVGTEDRVAKNQVFSLSTSFLDIKLVLQVVHRHGTDQRL
jgi:hypothetical protein